jgi:hypothetical protein
VVLQLTEIGGLCTRESDGENGTDICGAGKAAASKMAEVGVVSAEGADARCRQRRYRSVAPSRGWVKACPSTVSLEPRYQIAVAHFMQPEHTIYEVYEADLEGKPGPFEAAYDTVGEVLAHCEETAKPYAIKLDGAFLSLDRFMDTHVSAG